MTGPLYRYAWGPRFEVPGLPVLSRKDEVCRVLLRGRMNSALVEFVSDGFTAVVSRNSLRKADALHSRLKPEDAQ